MTGLRSSMAAAAAMLLASAPAQAVVIGGFTFDAPTGTISSTDSAPVVVTLTLDASSNRLSILNGEVVEGYSDGELALRGINRSTGTIRVSRFSTCSNGSQINTFVGGNCSSGPFTTTFSPSIFGEDFTLDPGQSLSGQFLSFTPEGVTPAGTYQAFNLGITLYFDPNDGSDDTTLDVLSVTSGSFTRVVQAAAVPEPATWMMLALGFGGVGLAMRRRRQPLTA